MAVHNCAHFFNNLRLMHKHAVKSIANHLASTSAYVNLPDENWLLSTNGIVYRPGIEKVIECYVDYEFSGGWTQGNDDNAENVMLCTGYVITYAGCPVLWCSNLQTEIALSTTEEEYIALVQAIHEVIPLWHGWRKYP